MSTRSFVGFPEGDGFRGRYVHFDGYPTARVPVLLDLIARDGVETVIQTVCHDHYGWSSLSPDRTDGPLLRGQDDGRFVAVPGYGIAYTTEQGQSHAEDWIVPGGDAWALEWGYVLNPLGIVILRPSSKGWDYVGIATPSSTPEKIMEIEHV